MKLKNLTVSADLNFSEFNLISLFYESKLLTIRLRLGTPGKTSRAFVCTCIPYYLRTCTLLCIVRIHNHVLVWTFTFVCVFHVGFSHGVHWILYKCNFDPVWISFLNWLFLNKNERCWKNIFFWNDFIWLLRRIFSCIFTFLMWFLFQTQFLSFIS